MARTLTGSTVGTTVVRLSTVIAVDLDVDGDGDDDDDDDDDDAAAAAADDDDDVPLDGAVAGAVAGNEVAIGTRARIVIQR